MEAGWMLGFHLDVFVWLSFMCVLSAVRKMFDVSFSHSDFGLFHQNVHCYNVLILAPPKKPFAVTSTAFLLPIAQPNWILAHEIGIYCPFSDKIFPRFGEAAWPWDRYVKVIADIQHVGQVRLCLCALEGEW